MGLLSRIVKASYKAIKAASQSERSQSGSFDYLSHGAPPELDPKGRVVCRLGGGVGIELDATSHNATEKAHSYLVGRRNEDFESRSVRLRIVRSESNGQSELSIETPNGDYVGWFRKESAGLANEIYLQLFEAIRQVDSRLSGELSLDVKALVEGSWEEDEDDRGKLVWVSDVSSITVQIKTPIEVSIKPQSVEV
jgi:hypothetical protein